MSATLFLKMLVPGQSCNVVIHVIIFDVPIVFCGDDIRISHLP